MKKEKIPSTSKIMVDIEDLKEMLSIGRKGAEKIAEEAGASIKIGRRRLYNVQKINEYINNLTAG